MITIQELADQFEQDGLPASTALEIARDLVRDASPIRAGFEMIATPDALRDLWERARADGARSLTMRLEIAPDGVRIAVLERSQRPERLVNP